LRLVASNVRAGRWWTLGAMTAALTLVFIDQTAVSVALPSIARDTGATHSELAWVVTAFLLPLAALAAVAARLGDEFGRARVLVIGIGVFTVASLGCGLAPSEEALIAARVVQGIGAAAMMPLTTAIVADTFGVAERGRAMGIYIGVASVFLSVGPLVGGLLSDVASWRWIFFVNLPVAAAAVAIICRYVPAGPRFAPASGFDVAGAALFAGGLGATVLAVLEGAAWGWSSGAVLSLLVVGVALLISFGALEARRRDPLIELRLLADPVLLGAVLAVVCGRFVTVGALVLSAIYLQQALGLSASRLWTRASRCSPPPSPCSSSRPWAGEPPIASAHAPASSWAWACSGPRCSRSASWRPGGAMRTSGPLSWCSGLVSASSP
jgi:MFS family permease